MKRIFFLILIGCLGSFFPSCSTQEPESNSIRASNAEPQTYINNNGQGDPANANTETAADRRARRLEEMRAAANNQTQKAHENTRPAPEDSEITTTLTDVARETRKWKKDPTLSKVEKIYDGQQVAVKVYLRDGRIIDLPGTAIAQLDQVTSATVLDLVSAGQNAQQSTGSGQPARRMKKASN